MPRWSVILPVRDGEEHIGSAVRSVLKALPADAELRLLDDGSVDSTPALISAFADADSRVKVSRHSVPKGVSTSLNELIRSSDSAYLARMDADDICFPNRWALGEKMLQSVSFSFTSVILINDRGKPFGVDFPGQFSADALPYHLLLGCGVVHPTVMLRRDALERVGGYRDTPAEDYDLWLRAAAAGESMMRSMSPGLAYRRHGSQVTGVAPWNRDGQHELIWQSYRDMAGGLLDVPEEVLMLAFPTFLHGSSPTPAQRDAALQVMSAVENRSAHC